MEGKRVAKYDGTAPFYKFTEELSALLENAVSRWTFNDLLKKAMIRFDASMMAKGEVWILACGHQADSYIITDTDSVEVMKWAVKSGKETGNLVKVTMTRAKHYTEVFAEAFNL